MAVGVDNAQQIVFRVISIVSHAVIGIGDRCYMVGIVIAVGALRFLGL
jgi:hypothetical protein